MDMVEYGGRAPDVFEPGGSIPMRRFDDRQEVDFAIVGTGAGGGTLAAKLAAAGFTVVAFDAGPFWRPLEEFASDEKAQQNLYWTTDRVSGGEHPLEFGANNSGQGVGGSTVHFTMVSLRIRPERFQARTRLGYGYDWPISWQEMWRYYEEAEQTMKISGPMRYPWGPPRGRYPNRPHEVNAAGLVLARAAEAMGIQWAPTPLATLSAPRGRSHPCVYRGFCIIGCSTNAKQSILLTRIPHAIRDGAEIRSDSMVGRIEMNNNGRVGGLVYRKDGKWRCQKARNVVVAGYAIETPRLLLNSACPQFPDGLANSSGMVGKNLMAQSNNAVWATMDDEIRFYKGPPTMAITEHWNYTEAGKDFPGGYIFLSQGPLPAEWGRANAITRGLWGMDLRNEMAKYIHKAGFKIVGEVEPREQNRVELADLRDQYDLPVAKVTFSFSENDQKLQRHALNFMGQALDAVGGRDLWETGGTAHLLGTCRMGNHPSMSVTNADGRTWDIPNLWICDGSLFPISGAVNPSLTIQALACRIGDRIAEMGQRGEV